MNKVLKELDILKRFNKIECNNDENVNKSLNIIERAIQIIKEYKVDIWLLQECDYENYIRIRKEAKIIDDLIRTDTDIVENVIPLDDFIFLKEMLRDE